MGRVALIGDNSPEYVSLILDIWNTGNSVVLLDKNIPYQKALAMMKEAEVAQCIIEEKIYRAWGCTQEDHIKYNVYTAISGKDSIVPEDIYNKFRFNYLNDEAVVIYSSGTTGQSRGVILSHFAINTNADAILEYMNLKKQDCLYIIKPLVHSSTLVGELLVALKSKVKLIISPTALHPRIVLDAIKKEEVTIIGVNPYWLNLLSDEYEKSSDRYNISSLHTMYVSGSILDQSTLEKANRVFYNANIYNVYGLSEASPRVTAQRSYCCNENSVGKPIRGVELIILNVDGNEVNKGERGIVHIKTPCLYSGYISGSEKHISLRKDWFNTGDIGYLDNFGELHIVGRVDDVVIINSHKIYPYDIEMLIKSSTDVEECVVVKSDDNIVTCLYVGPMHQPQYFISTLKTLLIPYEIPKRFIQCKSIPRNVNGKFDYCLIKKIVNDQ